jgi:hypothetical protein
MRSNMGSRGTSRGGGAIRGGGSVRSGGRNARGRTRGSADDTNTPSTTEFLAALLPFRVRSTI